MIDFQPLTMAQYPQFHPILFGSTGRGCAYNFSNLFLWGRQKAAVCEGNLSIFSQFNQRSVYLFPVGSQDVKPTLDAIIIDARERGIPCRFTSLTQEDCALLERLYPGQFRYHFDRDSFDYVYDINDLADLKGRKFQKKRNHLNRFYNEHPDYRVEQITGENLPVVRELVRQWYALRLLEAPHSDFHLEQAAIEKALRHFFALNMEGLLLYSGRELLAMTMGTMLSADTFDVQFEKSLDRDDGAYPAINREFALHLREKYPALRWLNREDDMGLEGLRKAKLSYNPAFMIEKYWACLWEDGCDD